MKPQRKFRVGDVVKNIDSASDYFGVKGEVFKLTEEKASPFNGNKFHYIVKYKVISIPESCLNKDLEDGDENDLVVGSTLGSFEYRLELDRDGLDRILEKL